MAIHRVIKSLSTPVTENTLQKFVQMSTLKDSRALSPKHVLHLARLITESCKENEPTHVSIIVVMVGETLTNYLVDGQHTIKALGILYRELGVDLRHVTILYTVYFADSEDDLVGCQF